MWTMSHNAKCRSNKTMKRKPWKDYILKYIHVNHIIKYLNHSMASGEMLSKNEKFTFEAMQPMKNFMSSWVGQLFWHGASAHFKHRAASLNAPRSLRVVCLMSSKFFRRDLHDCTEYCRIKILSNNNDDYHAAML